MIYKKVSTDLNWNWFLIHIVNYLNYAVINEKQKSMYLNQKFFVSIATADLIYLTLQYNRITKALQEMLIQRNYFDKCFNILIKVK